LADDEITGRGRQERFARWEQIGVDRIKADLLSGGNALVGGPPSRPRSGAGMGTNEGRGIEKIVM
jgi:hypothetical protein